MGELNSFHWVILLLGSAIMGLSKGGVPGAGNLTVALYVLVLEEAMGPAGVAISVGLLLPVLVSADLVSTMVYRKHVERKHILRLLPYFIGGVLLGWLAFEYFQAPENASSLKVLIGTILLAMTALRFFSQTKWWSEQIKIQDKLGLLGQFLGLLGGMATMLANAAGPIAQFYLLVMKLPKYSFIGTSAWLFLFINVFKLPLMYELGVLSSHVLRVSLWLCIPAVLGAWIAPYLVRHINQDWFERLIWFFIVVAGIRMIL